MVVSFIGGENRSTRKTPSISHKLLTNYISLTLMTEQVADYRNTSPFCALLMRNKFLMV